MYTFRMGKSGKIRIVIVAVCTVFVAVVFIAADYLFTFALDPLAKEDVFSCDEPEQDVVTDSTGQFDAETWLLTQAENVFITSYDGLQLHGYFIPAEIPSDRYVIAVHGYKSSAEAMADYAWHYYCQGWNVLVPEQRAHGLSEGRYIGMGCQERYDMLDWVDSILAENARARILFHGVSMGAATVMLVTGEPDLPENVCAAVEDCGYSSVTDQFTMQRITTVPADTGGIFGNKNAGRILLWRRELCPSRFPVCYTNVVYPWGCRYVCSFHYAGCGVFRCFL